MGPRAMVSCAMVLALLNVWIAGSAAQTNGTLLTGFVPYTGSILDGGFDITWTLQPGTTGTSKCELSGYYDNGQLQTPAAVNGCFTDLKTIIRTNYISLLAVYYTDVYYYPSDAEPYCAVICKPLMGNSAVSSFQAYGKGTALGAAAVVAAFLY